MSPLPVRPVWSVPVGVSARVVLLEQLYRAFTILGGEGYHKAG